MTGESKNRAERLEVSRFQTRDPALDRETRERFESCQAMVRSIAWRMHRRLPRHVELDDLIQFGQLGLVEASKNFDPSRGAKFSTFAFYRISGAIKDGLSKMAWFNLQDFYSSKYEVLAEDVLDLETDDAPPVRTEDDARWFRKATRTLAVVYLASSDREEEEGAPAAIDERTDSPESSVANQELSEVLHELIDVLPGEAGELIRAVYFDGLTLKDFAEARGHDKSWASRLHARTLRRLERALTDLGADDD